LAGSGSLDPGRCDAQDAVNGGRGSTPLGQRRPIAAPSVSSSPQSLLSWAHDQGLIELNPDGSWYFSEAALEWLSYQPLAPRRRCERGPKADACDA
jgi:hypothetical protein